MQHIGLQRETEDGEMTAPFDPDGIDLRIFSRIGKESMCLQFVDPYGDTVINQIQLPHLIAELADIRERSPEADLKEHIDGLLKFLRESIEVHSYVRFIGD